jgi:predicted metalloprotease with PDZ domain
MTDVIHAGRRWTMKRTNCLAMALAAVLALPALAGEKGEYKCTETAQSCLDQMAAKLKNRGWLGIEMDDSKGMNAIKITRVVPGSPAEAAGFEVDDVLVSLNGVKFADNTEEKCATCEAAKDGWVPDAKVSYVVNRNGRDVRLAATLAALPPDVLAQWVGKHMLEHAAVEVAEKK